ncbi:MAG: DUF3303 family protein [Candidatus Bathyarchaeia archaeon]
MKFIAFWEYRAEDTNKVIEKFRQVSMEREKRTEFAKLVYGPYSFNGERKGFSVYETDDPDKLMSLAVFYAPEMNWKFIPIIETAKGAELWLKMKK